MRVLKTKPLGDGKAGLAVLEVDGAEVEAWTPELELLKALGDGPIPPEWTLRDGPRGKQLLPPKKGGGGGYRNTKEAFEAEAASRRAWQELEEERKDRRTALMTAAEHLEGDVLEAAESLYAWLRGTAPGSAQNRSPSRSEARMTPSASHLGKVATVEGTNRGGGTNVVGNPPSPPAHIAATEKAIGRSLTPREIAEIEGTVADLGSA